MHKIQLVAVTPSKCVRLAWITSLSDGSVSVGLNDRQFRAERAETVGDDGQPVSIDWTQLRSAPAMVNPHFSYHPNSELVHLRAEGRPTLYSCLYPVRLLLQEQDVVEWVTWWTRALSSLSAAGPDDRPSGEICELNVTSDACAVELKAMFVLPGMPPKSLGPVLVVPLKDMQLCIRSRPARPGTPGFRFEHFS